MEEFVKADSRSSSIYTSKENFLKRQYENDDDNNIDYKEKIITHEYLDNDSSNNNNDNNYYNNLVIPVDERFNQNNNPEFKNFDHNNLSADTYKGIKHIPASLLEEITKNSLNKYLEKALIFRRSIFCTKKSADSIMTFQSSIIKKSLTLIPESHQSLVKQLFKNLMGYMQDIKSSKKPLGHIKKLLSLAKNSNQEIKDEVYLHIWKQKTNNPSLDSVMRAWKALACVSSTFAPSEKLFYSILNQLLYEIKHEETIQSNSDIIKHAQFIVSRLYNTYLYARKCVPSNEEILNIQELKPIPLTINLFSGEEVVIPVESYTTIRTVKDLVLKKINMFANINITSSSDYTFNNISNLNYNIFEIRKKTQTIEEGFIEECEHVCDILSKWEKEAEFAYKQRENVFNYLYLKTYIHPIYVIDENINNKNNLEDNNRRYSVISNVTGMLNDSNISSNNIYKYSSKDILALNQLYYESTYDYLRGYYNLDSEEILELSTLKLVTEICKTSSDNYNTSEYSNEAYKKLETNIEKYVPTSYIDLMSKEEWSQRIMDKFMKISDKDDVIAKRSFLNILKKNEFFGVHQFITKFTEDKNGPKSDSNNELSNYPEDILLCLSPDCIKLYTLDKNLLSTFKITNIINWGISSYYFVFVIPQEDNLVTKIYLESNQTKNIQYLLDYYSMMIAGKNINEIEAKSKENDSKFGNISSYRDKI